MPLVFVLGSLVFTSCENNDAIGVVESISEEETIALVELEDISDEMDNIVDDLLIEDFATSNKEVSSKDDGNNHGGMPDCVTKTVDMVGTTKTVTIDFGDACELPNGHMLSGKIIMVYVYDENSATVVITITYDGFYFNEVAVEGSKSIVRTRENENGNPQSINTINITLTWPDGEFISKEGTKTREWIEGYDTRTWSDNVYLITGSWTSIFKDGTLFSGTVIEALRREMSCRFIVSGIVEIVRGETRGVLNFGDGTCDNSAVFTDSEGVETEIILRRRKMWN
tara:strand:+ start:10063 stop:10911 length:849 start_codon:yes stop_codon:yes gene_type:complete